MTTGTPQPRHALQPGPWSRRARAVARHAIWIIFFAVPAIVLWWHVWSGHPSSTLTCSCGDPAQEVWFMAWPAWAIAHGASVFFSGAVNVPHGANLLSNTSGTLVGVVLSPITWLWGPVAATNVALTLGPALSSWGAWIAIRRFVTWKPAAVPAALVYGYSSAELSSLIFGHVSVTVLVIPPLLFLSLYDIFVSQLHSPVRNGLTLAALIVVQFLISPEILVMCALFAVIGLVVALAWGWRDLGTRSPHALRALGVGLGVSVAVLGYLGWYGLSGPQSVSGVLFSITPLTGLPLPGFLAPGPYGTSAGAYARFGGYLGRIGPDANFIGWGAVLWAALSVALTRRRLLSWFLVAMAVVVAWLSLGFFLQVGPIVLEHQHGHAVLGGFKRIWMPWRALAKLPVLKEILPDQLAPFTAFFLAILLALGLDAAVAKIKTRIGWSTRWTMAATGLVTVAMALVVLVPVFVTFDMPLKVVTTQVPTWMQRDAPKVAPNTVLLTVPFPVSGSTEPMLWQAVDGMHFRMAGAGLKTPNAAGGPVAQGAPGSARRIMSDLSIVGKKQPLGTAGEVATVRAALRSWHVNEVVIDGVSPDPVYTSGFLTEVVGTAPTYVDAAYVWRVPAHRLAPAALGSSLYLCRLDAPPSKPMSMANCVLKAAALKRARAARA